MTLVCHSLMTHFTWKKTQRVDLIKNVWSKNKTNRNALELAIFTYFSYIMAYWTINFKIVRPLRIKFNMNKSLLPAYELAQLYKPYTNVNLGVNI